jgi:hypothetical protein
MQQVNVKLSTMREKYDKTLRSAFNNLPYYYNMLLAYVELPS